MFETRDPGAHLLRFLCSLVLVGAVSLGAEVRLGGPAEHAVLRVALRTAASHVEICRDRTPEELEALPRHMRQKRVCDDTNVPFRLRVEVDGGVEVDRLVEASGDRPLVLDASLRVEPGTRSVRVALVPEEVAAPASHPEDVWRQAFARVPSYELVKDVPFAAGRVHLVTLDENRGRLRSNGGGD